MSYRTGRPAQDEFKLLCSLSEVTCNPSNEDDHGWDFIIEFLPPKEDSQPLDKIPGPRQAFVQVKSTQGQLPRTRMKVSNALKLSKSELPCFVVLFRYDKNGRKEVYVRHFWTDLIRRSLRRGREASAANKQAHDVWMEIGFSDGDHHTDDFIRWIIDTIESTTTNYSTKKQTLYDTLGYEGRSYRGEVTFGPINGIEELVDHHLGLTDYLPVSNVTVVDSRFGIDAPVPLIDNAHGRMQFRPNNARRCNIVLQNTSGDIASFEGTMKTPAIPNLPSDKFRILIETWCFSLSIRPEGDLTVQVRDLWNEQLSIERLVELSQFLSWGEEPITMKIVGADFPTINCRGQFSSSNHVQLFTTICNATKLLNEIQIRAGASAISLTFNDVRHSLRELSIFHTILTSSDMQLCADWDPSVKENVRLTRIFGHFDFQVGNLIFFVVIDASVIDRSTKDDGLRLHCGPRILRDCILGTDNDSVKADGTKNFEYGSRSSW